VLDGSHTGTVTRSIHKAGHSIATRVRSTRGSRSVGRVVEDLARLVREGLGLAGVAELATHGEREPQICDGFVTAAGADQQLGQVQPPGEVVRRCLDGSLCRLSIRASFITLPPVRVSAS
jgi:hypothetical protein